MLINFLKLILETKFNKKGQWSEIKKIIFLVISLAILAGLVYFLIPSLHHASDASSNILFSLNEPGGSLG